MTTDVYRPGVLPMPAAMHKRPVVRGYPVPWFVAQLPDGSYDFRVADGDKFAIAIREQRCWICGQRMGAYKAFALGPMCAVNRTTAEPPSHTACAEWAVGACPFLNQQMAHRRTGDMPPTAPPPGEMLTRQPGATLIWVTKRFSLFPDLEGRALIRVGDPERVAWYAEGRAATRAEVLASFDGGLPALWAAAKEDGPRSEAQLVRQLAAALQLVPEGDV